MGYVTSGSCVDCTGTSRPARGTTLLAAIRTTWFGRDHSNYTSGIGLDPFGSTGPADPAADLLFFRRLGGDGLVNAVPTLYPPIWKGSDRSTGAGMIGT